MKKQGMENLTAMLLGALMLLSAACADPNFKLDNPGDPFTLEGAVLQIALGTQARPVFQRSHDYRASSNTYCRNIIGIPALDSSDPNCTAANNCTSSATACPTTSNVGSCTTNRSLGQSVQDVYYPVAYNASSAASACSSLGGVFAATYVVPSG